MKATGKREIDLDDIRVASPREIQNIRRKLKSMGMSLMMNQDADLDSLSDSASKASAVMSFFPKGEGQSSMILRSKPTLWVMSHEYAHAVQFHKIGYKNYVKIGEYARELYVHNFLKKNQMKLGLDKYDIEDDLLSLNFYRKAYGVDVKADRSLIRSMEALEKSIEKGKIDKLVIKGKKTE